MSTKREATAVAERTEMTAAEFRQLNPKTAKPWNETDFQARVKAMAKQYGWEKPLHFLYAPGMPKGWVDLVLIGPRRADGGRLVLYRELKTSKGKLRPEQVETIAAMQQAGEDVGVWHPEDLPEIEALFEREAGLAAGVQPRLAVPR